MTKAGKVSSAVRRSLRARRAALDPRERRTAEADIRRRLLRLRLLAPDRSVAVYVAMPGEVDLGRVVLDGRRLGARLFAPQVMSRRRREMRFVPLGDRLQRSPASFRGLLEPADTGPAIGLRQLDAVLVPMVGFDRRGNRLGMGLGFYDRALRSRLQRDGRWRCPLLVGIAFACQEVERLEASSWDVPMDLIVTEREIIHPDRSDIDTDMQENR
jgi:5-formyltetrahydrofolate cyclo-ligase